MSTQSPDFHGYRFPSEIISSAVWLYHRFCLSLRDVEELLAERGVTVSYKAVRQWCLKFGPSFAKKLRQRQERLGDTWHLDEVFVSIQGRRHYLWRAVDQDGDVLDILVQQHRDQRAAKRFFRKLLIAWAAMVLPAESSCRASATAKTAGETTKWKSRINRRTEENARCAGLNPRGRYSGFFRSMARSTISSASAGISCQLTILVCSALGPLRCGER